MILRHLADQEQTRTRAVFDDQIGPDLCVVLAEQNVVAYDAAWIVDGDVHPPTPRSSIFPPPEIALNEVNNHPVVVDGVVLIEF